MDQIRKDGGPAFPLGYDEGMSLRDYFAAKAMQAMIAADQGAAVKLGDERGMEGPDVIARAAYGFAEAMLRARGE